LGATARSFLRHLHALQCVRPNTEARQVSDCHDCFLKARLTVEYRVEQHAAKLGDRLSLMVAVTSGNQTKPQVAA